MITIIYSTHKDFNYNDSFKKHLKNTIGVEHYEILEYYNYNEHSLSEIYNKGIEKAKYDIIVCCHNDIKLENNWGKKLLLDFKNNPDYGIIGKAGSCYFPESGIYWEKMKQTMVGQVYHQPENQKKWLSKFSSKLPFLTPAVTIDGLFISFDKTKIKHIFDETIGKFHFYDHGFCIPNFLDNIKIGVTSSFDITHQSVGQPNQEFWETKDKFIEKWGHILPLDLKPEKLFIPEIKEKPIKNIGKVAIIIPTKGKLDLLIPCVESFYEHCNPELFDIFIADTGSTDDEKNKIRQMITNKNNITFIEYNYYNFAKINNDVIKNYVGENHEFLLFCNNDIKVCNNVIYGMLKTFKENKKVGTIGGRLHFKDNTLQHGGIIGIKRKNNTFYVTHENLNSYYNYPISKKNMLGNTGALLMIKTLVFKQCGMFNENYINCFEDVELNLNALLLGYENIFDGGLVAYHYESSTRNDDEDNIKKMAIDYHERLIPFINKNFEKIKHRLHYED
jgi:GT2 family glycosyltransferase